MKTALSYLDDLKAAKGWPSDYRAAKELDIRQTTMSGYRTGASIPDDDVCWKVAEGLKIAPEVVIAAANAERAERTGNSAALGRWLARWERAVAACFVAGIGMLAALPSGGLYIMSNRPFGQRRANYAA